MVEDDCESIDCTKEVHECVTKKEVDVDPKGIEPPVSHLIWIVMCGST